ncbi:hypothetical protein Q5H92_11800 [Hymenobacter sp. M29]|uniref:Tetratricopeptide repeat protein n=1 Tax=Hymenobacter mellowenesis TaxID=3063995 RepID=A0ABT9AB31_9BACT|nr:hypothetical protein [Hymenobacter sp. M29]MDO7847045.1 hypothetical protein [Hymenobacter sp. M29]
MNPKQVSTRAWRPSWLGLLATLAVGLAIFYYFTGPDSTLPMQLVPHLEAVPLTLERVAAGPVSVPVQASGFIVSLTHDVVGPFTQPVAAALFLVLLAMALVGWVAVASTLARPAFVAGMIPVIFLLLSLNTESLGIFNTSERYFLYLMLGLVGGGAYGLHAFAEDWPLRRRVLLLGAVVAGLAGLLYAQSQLSAVETTLQLAAYATTGGAVLVALLVLWVGVENIRALLWLNGQAEQPASRFGLGPFVAASLLYLGMLLLYVWNDGLQLLPGLNFDPLVLLLPAVLAGGLGLRLRAPSYAGSVPYAYAAVLYPLVVTGAAAVLAYAFATDNTPLLAAARSFTGLALLLVGGAFWLYVLINFMPLIQQRLRVYRVAFEPRRLPLYTVYVLAIGGIIIIQSRRSFPLPDQVQAGQYNNLGDLARQQSEAAPDDLGLAALAERYYAESGDVLYRANLHAQFGRAALYRFRQQRGNELVALNRALLRGPSEKVAVRLGALYTQPDDLFEGLDILRRGLKAQPGSAALAGDLAQLFTKTSITDSVGYYLDQAERLNPGSYASRTNQLGFLLSQNLYAEARKQPTGSNPATEPALTANQLLLGLLTKATKTEAPATPRVLDDATFAALYHAVLMDVKANNVAGLKQHLQPLATLAKAEVNAPYYEQLLFLQAYARHGLGQEMTARQQLLPLATGTSGTAAYYQMLLGLWQLQQGQYATAADQLAFAAAHGATQAGAARAYALALAGRTDSAQAQAARLAASPDTSLQRLGRRAQTQLAASSFRPEAGNAARVGQSWLTQARQAEQANRPKDADKLYQRIVREAPFNEEAVLAAGRFYAQRRNPTGAYGALRAGLDENPESLPLLKAYVLAAADAGLTEYAGEALGRLQQQLPPATYVTLAAEYARHRAARVAVSDSFSVAPAAVPFLQ